MKLQKRFSRKVKGVVYVKWVITIPPEMVEELNWAEGEELKAKANRHILTIRQASKRLDEFGASTTEGKSSY